MRNELEWIELIERYLRNELSESEKADMEQQLVTNPELKKQLELQRQLLTGINRYGLRHQLQQAFKQHARKQWLKKGSIGFGVAIVVGVVGYALFTRSVTPSAPSVPLRFEDTAQCDADRYLPVQQFTIAAASDTVIQTEQGILFSIPAHCFLNTDGKLAEGPVLVEIKEALDALSIIKAGLSTESNGQLLQTGGMFYINAKTDGRSLAIDPNNAVYASIPCKEKQPDMQLFDGQRLPDGGINWVDPKPLENYLVPVDIRTLDFYPPHYLDSLAGMGYDPKDKQFTDSLYYSFASRFNNAGLHTITNDSESSRSGIELFIDHCASCHTVNDKIVGPALKDISKRYDEAWLIKFIRNSQAMIKAGDKKALKVFNENGGSIMTSFESLSDNEIRSILEFIKTPQQPLANATNEYVHVHEEIVHLEGATDIKGVNPAKVKTIWQPSFNGTNIATREFEERLRAIHRSCYNDAIDLYLDNLDKNLCTVDSMVAQKWNDQTFYAFAARGDGKVGSSQKQLRKLAAYYEKSYREYTKKMGIVLQRFMDKQQKLADIAKEKYSKQSHRDSKRNSANLNKEFQINLKEAYRQLGDTLPKPPPSPANSYGAIITNTGWKNVDAVWQATANRETIQYTNKGKKAVIKYDKVTIQITKETEYERVVVYLLPDQLNSFMRIETNMYGSHMEKLNELMKYKLVCIGYKGEDVFSYIQEDIRPGRYMDLTLTKTDERMLKKQLNKLDITNESAFQEELTYQQFVVTEQQRKKKLNDRWQFIMRIEQVIFPCWDYGPVAAPAGVNELELIVETDTLE
jgi:cytochrome c551/c552